MWAWSPVVRRCPRSSSIRDFTPGRRSHGTALTRLSVVSGGYAVSGKAEHEATLPRGLYCTRVIMVTHEVHRLTSGYPVQNGEAGQGSSCSAPASAARDFHALSVGASPCDPEDLSCLRAVAGQSEVPPEQPLRFPRNLRRRRAKQVDAVVRHRTLGKRLAQSSTTDQASGRKLEHSLTCRFPRVGHVLSLVFSGYGLRHRGSGAGVQGWSGLRSQHVGRRAGRPTTVETGQTEAGRADVSKTP